MTDDYERRCAELDALVDSDPLRLRDEAIKLLHDAEQSRAAIARVRAQAERWKHTPDRKRASIELLAALAGEDPDRG
jgi:hypothetical protein